MFLQQEIWHLESETFQRSAYLALLPPDVARVLLRARLPMLDMKMDPKKKDECNLNCPFCNVESEHFDHIFASKNPYIRTAILRTLRMKFSFTYHFNIRCSLQTRSFPNLKLKVLIYGFLLYTQLALTHQNQFDQ